MSAAGRSMDGADDGAGRRTVAMEDIILSDTVNELADLIADALTAPNATSWRGLAQRIIDAGYRRVVVDDAMIERTALALAGGKHHDRCAVHGDPLKVAPVCDCYVRHHHDKARAALTAALEAQP